MKKPSSEARDMAVILATGSICLFHRNPEMSRVQTAMGLCLDESGATDTVSKLTLFQFTLSNWHIISMKLHSAHSVIYTIFLYFPGNFIAQWLWYDHSIINSPQEKKEVGQKE